ncbi:MAG: hypothetical protein K1X57_06450 [Gemmataceae bacterium]|nr:hypothetical protein [Gemmataceae bacterium]
MKTLTWCSVLYMFASAPLIGQDFPGQHLPEKQTPPGNVKQVWANKEKDACILVREDSDTIELWNMSKNRLLFKLAPRPGRNIRLICPTSDGKALLVASPKTELAFFDLPSVFDGKLVPSKRELNPCNTSSETVVWVSAPSMTDILVGTLLFPTLYRYVENDSKPQRLFALNGIPVAIAAADNNKLVAYVETEAQRVRIVELGGPRSLLEYKLDADSSVGWLIGVEGKKEVYFINHNGTVRLTVSPQGSLDSTLISKSSHLIAVSPNGDFGLFADDGIYKSGATCRKLNDPTKHVWKAKATLDRLPGIGIGARAMVTNDGQFAAVVADKRAYVWFDDDWKQVGN